MIRGGLERLSDLLMVPAGDDPEDWDPCLFTLIGQLHFLSYPTL